jgi:hypothetical protein
MTTYVTDEIDFDALDTVQRMDLDAINAEYRAIVQIVGHDWLKGDEDFATFIGVLMVCRQGADQLISQNDVRVRLLEDTAKGPRCSIEPHRYSALWSRARSEGFIERAKADDGRKLTDECTTSPTGNNGKPQSLYRWIRGAA